MPVDRELFRESNIDPTWYPRARKGRSGSPAPLAQDVTPAPRTRIFPFFFTFAANRRRSFTTPRLIGPAIIKDLELYPTFTSSPPSFSVEIGAADTAFIENSVALTTPRPYTVLTELLDPYAAMPANVGAGYPGHTLPTETARYQRNLDLIVTTPEFFAVVALINPSAFAAEYSGAIRIIENVSREALATFL